MQPFRPNREPVVDAVKYRSPSVPVWVSRNKPTGSGRKREPSQVEARINQAASKRRVRKLILNFVISTGVLGFVTSLIVFSIASYRVPGVARFEAIDDYFSLVVFASLMGGTLWTLAVMAQGDKRR